MFYFGNDWTKTFVCERLHYFRSGRTESPAWEVCGLLALLRMQFCVLLCSSAVLCVEIASRPSARSGPWLFCCQKFTTHYRSHRRRWKLGTGHLFCASLFTPRLVRGCRRAGARFPHALHSPVPVGGGCTSSDQNTSRISLGCCNDFYLAFFA